MLTREEEAHLEGAKNLYRYNRKDLVNVAVLVGFALSVVFGCWTILHVVDAFGHGCGPYGCHIIHGTPRLNTPWYNPRYPTLPTYRPLYSSP